LLSGITHIITDHKKNYPATYVFKPLTVIIIIAAVFQYTSMDSYAILIIGGLILSLFGDIFLMLKQQKFIAGLSSFLLAHLVYIFAFYQALQSSVNWLTLSYFALPGLLYYGYLYGGLGKLKAPVFIYVCAIVLMAFFSFNAYLQNPSTAMLAAFIGALIFMVSDATLALNKFKVSFGAAQAIILSTYYTAQWAIAYSAFDVLHNLP
jgi:uncharacterized membrane protein YhhN